MIFGTLTSSPKGKPTDSHEHEQSKTKARARIDGVKTAAKVLRSGGLAAFPTETVYGLGADATNDTAVAKIYEAKGRPQFNPLIVHAADKEALRSLVEWSTLADALADAFWPGPLTFVLPRTGDCPVSLLASAGLDTLAVRVPSLDLARSLLRACRFPVAAPSANASGHISPTTADHVSREFGSELAVILDGGPSQIGLESTVIDLTTDKPVLCAQVASAENALRAPLERWVWRHLRRP